MTNKCLVINNVVNYKYDFGTLNLIYNTCIDSNNINYKNEKSYYYILDSGSEEMGYWIFESLIFIDLLKKINRNNREIKILSNIKREPYIREFMKKLQITNDIVYKIENYNNICYSPLIYSIYYLHRLEQDEYYKSYLQNFIEYGRKNELIVKNEDIKIEMEYNDLFFYNSIFLKNKEILLIESDIYKPNGIYTYCNGFPIFRYIFSLIIKENRLFLNT